MIEQLFELSGYRLFAKVEGRGEPLLILHSYWGSLVLFDQLSLALSKRWMVIRIDLPGHGNSGTPATDYTFEKFAPVLNELLLLLNVREEISIIGHSMGGYVALAFAAKFPERIASLVLMHSPVESADAQSIKQREREGHLLIKGKRELLLQVSIPSNFAPGNVGLMDHALALLNKTSNQVTLEGALQSIYAINHRGNSLGALQQARYPVLIIIGKYDKVYSPGEQIVEAGQIPNAEVILLDHSGHLGFIEEEELVIMKIGEFLGRKL